EISRPPEEVWALLFDPQRLAAVIPGCREIEMVGRDAYRASVTLGAGPVRGRFEVNLQVSDAVPHQSAILRGRVLGPLGSGAGEGRIRLAPTPRGTRVSYEYEISVAGMIASVGSRMLDGAAKLFINGFFDRLE